MRTALFLFLSLSAAGCGKSSHEAVAAPVATAAPSNVDACTLVSRTDVQSIFGELKGDPKASTGLRGEHECRYQSLDGHWLEVSVYGVERWDLEKGIVSEQHPAAVPNLGEEAFEVKQGNDKAVYVRKGADILEVRCSTEMKTAEAIATKAIAKL